MKAIDRPFTNIINGTTQFVIPVFQRDYSWTEEECEQLWKDILHVAGDRSGRGHFLGSVVYVSTGDTSAGFTRWMLVHGQQRLTTLTLILIALRDHIDDTGWQGGDDGPTPNRVEAYFLKNLHEEGEREHKLVLRRHDRATLQALIDKKDRPAPFSERILENYEFFREQLRTADPAEVYAGVGRLVVVDVTLDRVADDPQLIFESLNSTGMDLSQSDLIRNFILMRLPEKDQTRLYESYWNKIEALFQGSEKTFDDFARDYLALKTAASRQEKAGKIYQAFRRKFQELQDSHGGLEGLLRDMVRYARYHATFALGRSAPEPLADSLSHLRRLVDLPAILMMRLFDCHERLQTLSMALMNEAIRVVESYIFRRAICGEQTHSHWVVFANLAQRIGEESPVDDLRAGLGRQRDNCRFPAEAELRRALLEPELYGLRVCSHLLERLENYDTNEPTDTSNYSIEHILPQNEKLSPEWRTMLGDNWREIQREWVHRLGNLTLTGYNSKYSDRPFEEKKTIRHGFSDSAVRLNKYVREQSVWTSKKIEERGKRLAELALKVWPALKVERHLLEAAAHREMQELASRRGVDKVAMTETARTLFERLRALVLEIDDNILEVAEAKSVSYHAPSFFLEVLPRKQKLTNASASPGFQ